MNNENLPIQAIMTYSIKAFGICGQTIGADGSGEYGVVFKAKTTEGAYKMINEHIKKLKSYSRCRIENIVYVVNEERFSGVPLHIIEEEKE